MPRQQGPHAPTLNPKPNSVKGSNPIEELDWSALRSPELFHSFLAICNLLPQHVLQSGPGLHSSGMSVHPVMTQSCRPTLWG